MHVFKEGDRAFSLRICKTRRRCQCCGHLLKYEYQIWSMRVVEQKRGQKAGTHVFIWEEFVKAEINHTDARMEMFEMNRMFGINEDLGRLRQGSVANTKRNLVMEGMEKLARS